MPRGKWLTEPPFYGRRCSVHPCLSVLVNGFSGQALIYNSLQFQTIHLCLGSFQIVGFIVDTPKKNAHGKLSKASPQEGVFLGGGKKKFQNNALGIVHKKKEYSTNFLWQLSQKRKKNFFKLNFPSYFQMFLANLLLCLFNIISLKASLLFFHFLQKVGSLTYSENSDDP